MYWPLGVASLFSPPPLSFPDSDAVSPRPGDGTASLPLISIAISASGNLIATATAQELYVWQIEVCVSFHRIEPNVIADQHRVVSTEVGIVTRNLWRNYQGPLTI